MNGFLLIDKDKGMTSFDVVREVRRATGVKKVGHSGTLDPLATGLLIVAIGEGTKLLEYLIGVDKEYEVVGRFGYISDSYDADGEVQELNVDLRFTEGDLLKVIREKFIGYIQQIPPKYSALKIKGKKAYELARQGKVVELEARNVRIDSFDIEVVDWPEVSFRVKCGSGTYIRSLIHDLGQELGCGAYVFELRRTLVGNFSITDAVKLDELSKNIEQNLVSMETVARKFDFIDLEEEEWGGLQDGKTLLNRKFEHKRPVMAFYREKLVGVLKNAKGDGIKFRKVIHGAN